MIALRSKSIQIRPILSLCYVVVFLYIVTGNAFTINFGYRFPIKIAEIASVILIIVYLFKNKRFAFRQYELHIFGWLILTAVVSTITTLRYNFSLSELAYGLMYPLRVVLVVLTANVCFECFKHYGVNNIKIINYILNLYIVECMIGFFQLAFYPIAYDFYDVFQNIGFYIANPDPHIGRLVSLYFDPNFLASCLIIPAAISLYEWKNGLKYRLIYFAIYGFTIVLTDSRSGILGLMIIITFSIFERKNTKKALLSELVLIVGVAIIIIIMFNANSRIALKILNTVNDSSAQARVDSWQIGIDIITQHPIIGIGYNMIGTYREQILNTDIALATGYGNDSSLVVICICSGLIGIIYFIVTLTKDIFKKCQIKNKISKKIVQSIIIASLVITNFNNLLFYTLYQFPLMLLMNTYISNNEGYSTEVSHNSN